MFFRNKQNKQHEVLLKREKVTPIPFDNWSNYNYDAGRETEEKFLTEERNLDLARQLKHRES